jgi:hypothetical protein
MKQDKDKLIIILKLAKDQIVKWEQCEYICHAILKVSLSNTHLQKECKYLRNKIDGRLGTQTANTWVYYKRGEFLNHEEMKQWRGQWIDMLVAEIEQHGRLK